MPTPTQGVVMICQAPDSQFRFKKKVAWKVVDRQKLAEAKVVRQQCPTPKLCARPNFFFFLKKKKKTAESCMRGPTFKKGSKCLHGIRQRRKRLPSQVANFRIWGGDIGSRSSRRLQLTRDAHNKCIASGQQAVGHALSVCSFTKRYSNGNRRYRDDSAQPRERNNNDNTSMQQQALYFNATAMTIKTTAVTTTACPHFEVVCGLVL